VAQRCAGKERHARMQADGGDDSCQRGQIRVDFVRRDIDKYGISTPERETERKVNFQNI